jgi:hypothetical protein
MVSYYVQLKENQLNLLGLSALSVGYKWLMFRWPSLCPSLGCDVTMEPICPSSPHSNVTSDPDEGDRYILWNISHLKPTRQMAQEDFKLQILHTEKKIKFSELVRGHSKHNRGLSSLHGWHDKAEKRYLWSLYLFQTRYTTHHILLPYFSYTLIIFHWYFTWNLY